MTRRSGPAPPDQAARHQAATDFSRNLVVMAGAGTGKTSLLVERLLTALGAGRVTLGEVAGITFTEKAAGEMRERLALGLERLWTLARGEGEPDGRRAADRAFLHLARDRKVDPGRIAHGALQALTRLDRATITTLHGFCAEMLRVFPRESGVDPRFTVDPGEHYQHLLDEAWDRFLAGELGPNAPREDLWIDLLGRISLEQVRLTARALAAFRIPEELLIPPHRPVDDRALFAAPAHHLAGRIEGLLEGQQGMTAPTLGFFRAMRDACRLLGDGGLGPLRQAIRKDRDLARAVARTTPPRPNRALTGVSAGEFEALARESLRLLRNLAVVDETTFDLMVETAAPFALRARERYLRQGYLDFDGLLVLARNLLRDHVPVRRTLKQRYRLLLVDEFQDTDPLQYEIVLFLAEKAAGEARDPYRAELDPGRLFVVGDPKQSIYRFRGADFIACRRAVDRIEEQGGKVLDLTANFRGVPRLLEPVNTLFQGAPGDTWRPSPYQPPYRPIEPVRANHGSEPRVEVWTVDPGPDISAPLRRLAEGRVLAREIHRMARREESCAFGQISLLLRSFTHLSLYLRSLREWDIPFVVDGGREFLARPEVGHLMAVLRALARPADPVALLAYLRSPAGGVPDTELAAYAARDGHWSWRTRVDKGRFPRLARAFHSLVALDRETQERPVDAMVRRVLAHTHLLALDAAAFEGPQRVANLRKLAATAADLARDGALSLNQVLDALEQGRGADVESDSPLADETTDAVRVVTIHKAKGLENEIIFLPDLARARSTGGGLTPRPVELARLPDGGHALALRAEGCCNTVRVWFDEEERRHDLAEETRVLYVALTRARERLVLLAGPATREAPWLEALQAWGYTAAAPPQDGDTLLGGQVRHRHMAPSPPPSTPSLPLAEAIPAAVQGYAEAVTRLREAARSPFRRPSGDREDPNESRSDDPEEAGVQAAHRPADLLRTVGLVAHRLLEHWEGDDGTSLRRRSGSVCRVAASQEGVSLADLEEEVNRVIEAFLASPLAGRLRRISVLGREVPLLFRGDEAEPEVIWRGFIDLLYRDPDGRVVVADYKTDLDLDGDAAEARYRPQLRTYARAVQSALSLPDLPRAELWMLRTGERRTVALTDGGSGSG